MLLKAVKTITNTTNETQDAFPINGICIHMPVEDDLFDDEDDKSQDVKMGGESSMQMAGSL